jgi:hypothetical protein
VIASYKKLNSLNYSLIEAFENLLPTYVFSLRGKMEAEEINIVIRKKLDETDEKDLLA